MMFSLEEIENLKLLIQSPDEGNVRLAFGILKGQEMPQEVKLLLGEYEKAYNFLQFSRLSGKSTS